MTNIKQFPGKKTQENTKTESYIMQEVLYNDQSTKSVPDLEGGPDRNRRWGIVLSLTVVPQFDKVPLNQGPLLLPKTPSRFIAADSLEDLRERVNTEIDSAMSMAELAVNDPDEYIRLQTEAIRKEMPQEEHVPVSLEDDMS
jgi:hypothetical protein